MLLREVVAALKGEESDITNILISWYNAHRYIIHGCTMQQVLCAAGFLNNVGHCRFVV